MGDRCYMTMQLGGHVETVEDFNTILELIDSDCGHVNDISDKSESIAEYLVRMSDEEEVPQFGFEEVNYAELDCAGKISSECGMDIFATNDAGGGYSAGNQSWDGQTGHSYEWTDAEDGSISISAIRECLDPEKSDSECVAAIFSAIHVVEREQWCDLRPFTVSNAVRMHVLKRPEFSKGMSHALRMMQRAA